MERVRRLASAILGGTLIPVDRVAEQKPCYSGKHKRHGVKVQVIADAAGRLVRASAACPTRPELDFDGQSAEQVRRQHRLPSDLGAEHFSD